MEGTRRLVPSLSDIVSLLGVYINKGIKKIKKIIRLLKVQDLLHFL